jgi:hypothetical protein
MPIPSIVYGTEVRSGSISDLQPYHLELPLILEKRPSFAHRAMSLKCHNQKCRPYSITSPARASSTGGDMLKMLKAKGFL